jgi:hypothetical protein
MVRKSAAANVVVVMAAAALSVVTAMFAAEPAREPAAPAREAGTAAPKPAELAKDAEVSDAVTENKAEFQTIAQPNWAMPRAGAPTKVQVGLRVTNPGPLGMRLAINDTIRVVIKDADGKELAVRAARDASFIPTPLLLGAKTSQSVLRDCTLERTAGDTCKLTGPDGGGGLWWVDGLKAGKYAVRIDCTVDDKTVGRARATKGVPDPKAFPFWTGHAVTKEVTVEIGAAVAAAR